MRKALCVGIDCYEHVDDLHGCVNDANSVKAALERNGDGTLNFEVKLMCATSEASYINRNDLRDAIENLFKTDSEIAVLYYSGHGSFDALGGYLCTSEIQRPDEGVSLNEVMGFVAQSKARNKIIILDSCFSGAISNPVEMQNYSVLHNGTTILAACGPSEYASEENGHGIFTSLLVGLIFLWSVGTAIIFLNLYRCYNIYILHKKQHRNYKITVKPKNIIYNKKITQTGEKSYEEKNMEKSNCFICRICDVAHSNSDICKKTDAIFGRTFQKSDSSVSATF